MGKRGEGWVVGQFAIGILIALSVPFWRIALPLPVHLFGIVLIGLGGILLAAAMLSLGANFSVLPRPLANHSLVTSGVYAIVRHPIYAAVLLAAFGWGLLWGSLVSLAFSVVLLVWLDRKSRLEEEWLSEKYAEYAAYQARVKKLVPFIY